MLKTKNWIASVLLIASTAILAVGQRQECFPFEKLAPEKREAAMSLLLKTLDSEALFTVVGGMKPMSSGFARFQIDVRPPRDEAKATERRTALEKLNETREILGHFRCGDSIFADVHHFSRAFEGKRNSDAVVFNTKSLEKMLRAKSDFFDRWSITPLSHPLQVLYAVENEQTEARFGGYGYLFGYPDYAVRFFVQAADEEAFSGKFVERDFFSSPTFSSPKNGFVYAVPKGQTETEADKNLKAKAGKIFEDYSKRREQYIGEGKKGVLELIRDMLCDSSGKCAAQ